MKSDTPTDPRLAPVVTLRYEQADDGTWRAMMTVSGLDTEWRAIGAVNLMEKLFCGAQQEPKQ